MSLNGHPAPGRADAGASPELPGQRNAVGGTGDRCRHSVASVASVSSVSSVASEQEKNPGADDCETERGRPGAECGGRAVAAAGAVTAPDGGWGWVVLVAAIVDLALTLAFPACMGIFFTDLQKDFHTSNFQTSLVFSIMTAAVHAGGPLCSVLVERWGCRPTVMLGGVLSGFGMAASSFTQTISQLYVTAGVITGLGFCISFQPAVTILGHYFVRRRAFANAMSSTGTALGLCTLPFLANYLHTKFGWRGSYLILGAVLLNICVCGAVMRPLGTPNRRGQPPMADGPPLQDNKNDANQRGRMRAMLRSALAFISRHMAFDQLCSNRRYLFYALSVTWMMLGFVVPLVYLIPYATANKMDPGRAAQLISILGVVNIVVRPPFGVVFSAPWFKGRHVYVYAAALLVNGLCNNICCAGASFPVLATYVVVFGLSMSVVAALMYTVLMSIVEMRRFPAALGLLAVMQSFTLLIGPPLAGAMVDRTGEYFHIFIASSVVVASAALFLLVSFNWLDKRDRKLSKQSQPSLSSLNHP